MRINSFPITCLYLSFLCHFLQSSTFISNPPPNTYSSSILHLSLKCFSYLQSPLYPPTITPTLHHPSLSPAVLPQSLFYACLLFTKVYHSRGCSQSLRSHFITLPWVMAPVWAAGCTDRLDHTRMQMLPRGLQPPPKPEPSRVSSVLLKTEWDCSTHTAQHYIPKLLVPDSVLRSALSTPPRPIPAHTHTQQHTRTHTNKEARFSAHRTVPL